MSNGTLFVLTSGVIAVGLFTVSAAEEWRQEWRMKRSGVTDNVHFTIKRHRAGSQWTHSTDVPLNQFRGFSISQLERGGAAKFEYVQDAGTLVCEGNFSGGQGSGSYTLTPNAGFTAELQKLGYSAPSNEDLFSMLMSRVTLDFARQVKNAGLNASTRQLVELRIHGIDSDYIRETMDAGYRNMAAKDMVEMKIHGVSTAFLRDLKATGYELQPKEIVELRIHGVDTELIRELKQAGFSIPAREIVELRIHGVSPAMIRELKVATGATALTTKEIVELRLHGVSPAFVKESKDLGYTFTTRELTNLRMHGVDGAYLRRLRDAGFRNLNADQITKLRIHGID